MNDLSGKYRHLFPVFEKVNYLNSCSQGALAIPVRDAIDEYMEGMYEKGSRWNEWVSKQEELRNLVAKAFSTSPSNVAITSNASSGINSVLSSFDFSGSKNRIITTDLEFPTMGQILHAQERRGATIVHFGTETDGTLDLTKFESSLDERVALVAVTHVCYRTGAMLDLESITNIAHTHGIPVLVDAYQSAGSFPIHFDDIGADFLVAGFLKYMLGLPGIAFLLSRNASQFVPVQTGWFAARDIFAMEIERYDPSLDARRFETGTPPIPSVYGAVSGLHLLLEVGLKEAWQQVYLVHTMLRECLQDLGVRVITPTLFQYHGAMIAFEAPKESALVNALEDDGIIVSSRGGNLRVSPHFYNGVEDVEELMKSLRKHQDLLK